MLGVRGRHGWSGVLLSQSAGVLALRVGVRYILGGSGAKEMVFFAFGVDIDGEIGEVGRE